MDPVLRLAVAAALAAVTLLAVLTPPTPPAPPAPEITGEIQHFSLSRNPRAPVPFRFTDAAGRSLSLADFRGRVVVVNFWATWCAPCVHELPSLDALAGHFKGKPFALVALNEDRNGETVAPPFIDRLGLKNMPLYFDVGGRAQRALGVGALPTTVVFDARGREIGRLVGPAEWNSAEARALIAHFVKNSR